MEGVHLIVLGRVQGVGFRYYTKERADRLGIVGTVENKYYGTYRGAVEIFAFGKAEILERFCESVSKGFSNSYVKSLLKKKITPENLQGFTIL